MRRQTSLLLILLLPACTSWQVTPLPSPETTEWSLRGHLKVTTPALTRVGAPADSIRLESGSYLVALRGGQGTISIPRATPMHIMRRRFSESDTVILLFAAVLGMAILNGDLAGGDGTHDYGGEGCTFEFCP